MAGEERSDLVQSEVVGSRQMVLNVEAASRRRTRPLVRSAFKQIGGCGVNFGWRHVAQVSSYPPFVSERIAHAGEAFTPKHVRWLRDDHCPVAFHPSYHCVTIVYV